MKFILSLTIIILLICLCYFMVYSYADSQKYLSLEASTYRFFIDDKAVQAKDASLQGKNDSAAEQDVGGSGSLQNEILLIGNETNPEIETGEEDTVPNADIEVDSDVTAGTCGKGCNDEEDDGSRPATYE